MSMIDTPEIAALGRFLDVDVFRHGLISSNLANVDTPGYRTLDINFRQELDRAEEQAQNAQIQDGQIQDASLLPIVQRVQGLMERPDGNNVSLEREGLLLAETQLRYNLGVQLLRDQFHIIGSAIHEGSTS